ncbi:hypothetical protein GCM10009838_69220 [Catenulispora subtropica]|uniref:Uncharacterized protein n=1 Tax=Catenulispora subtropica TaxID=450798 RepID=A0ABP5EFI9_9ACTN
MMPADKIRWHALEIEVFADDDILPMKGMRRPSRGLLPEPSGRPTLRRTMKLVVLAALEQRTSLRYTMPGTTAAETASYIKHHLGLAGRADNLFTDDAFALIHTTARGFPRAVNNLALQSLVATFAGDKSLVDENAVRSAVAEVLD